MKAATYCLKACPPSFDFLMFLVMARTQGYEEVLLDTSRGFTRKWSEEECRRRVRDIVIPAGEFAGMSVCYGEGKGECSRADCGLTGLLTFLRARDWQFERLQSVRPPGPHRYTVTLRNNHRHPVWNSRAEDWRRVAALIGAHVIEDAADRTIDIRDQMALYAGAEMNFMMMTGPANLCWLSTHPVRMFVSHATTLRAHWWPKAGMRPGEQLGCFLPTQRLVWADDTYDNLVACAAELGPVRGKHDDLGSAMACASASNGVSALNDE